MPSKKSKNKVVALEELSKDELIKKCYNQRTLIKQLQDAGKFLLRKVEFLESFDRATSMSRKVEICYNETMSLFDDIEQLKNEVKSLKGEL